jgi:hypothetical protein
VTFFFGIHTHLTSFLAHSHRYIVHAGPEVAHASLALSVKPSELPNAVLQLELHLDNEILQKASGRGQPLGFSFSCHSFSGTCFASLPFVVLKGEVEESKVVEETDPLSQSIANFMPSTPTPAVAPPALAPLSSVSSRLLRLCAHKD